MKTIPFSRLPAAMRKDLRESADQAKNSGSWRHFGRLYGYKRCCIASFHRGDGVMLRGPHRDTGFVPCKKCAALIAEIGLPTYVCRVIIPRRKTAEPFDIPHLSVRITEI